MNSNKLVSHTIIILLGVIISLGCTSPEEKELKLVRKNTEEFIKKGMGKPSSYEFISIEKSDKMITQGNNIDHRIELFKRFIESTKSTISSEITRNEYSKQLFPDTPQQSVDSTTLKRRMKILEQIQEWSKTVDPNEVGCLTYNISFRGENPMGGMGVFTGTVYTKPDLTVEVVDIGNSNPLYTCGEKEEYFKIVSSTQ